MLLHAFTDSLLFMASFVVAGGMVAFAEKTSSQSLAKLLRILALFVLVMGTVHLVGAFMIGTVSLYPLAPTAANIELQGFIKFLAAAAAIATAVVWCKTVEAVSKEEAAPSQQPQNGTNTANSGIDQAALDEILRLRQQLQLRDEEVASLKDQVNQVQGDDRDRADFKINVLNEALRRRLIDLEKANEELNWVARELQIARDQALAASKAKSQFLANMSHEIRTPLNGLIATTELLLNSQLSHDQREFATISRDSALSLLETVNALLDYSRLEAGKLDIELEEFDLVTMVEGTAELLSDKAHQKKLSLMTYVAPDVPARVCGDPTRVRQVLLSLMGNGIKFTDSGEVLTRVTVETTTDLRVVLKFAVYDTGIGIADKLLKKLFEPFVQGDASTTKRHDGAGLGLSIAKKLVNLMHGEIGAESVPGQGSTFWFNIPFERIEGVKPVGARIPQHHLHLENLRLLVVHGAYGTSEIIQDYAAGWHIRCDSIDGGLDVVGYMTNSFAAHKPFDIAIIEYELPHGQPFDMARAIKSTPELANTKLILIANCDEENRGHNALTAGYSAFMTKPIKQSQLFDAIANVMDSDDHDLVCCEPAINPTVVPPEQIVRSLDPRKLILIAEDNPVNQRVARLQLEQLGYNVHVVNNGREAVDAVSKLQYAIVFMDCQMPELDGFEATNAIRKQDALAAKRTLIVAMTAHALEGDREKCLTAGMDDYISKPVSREKLESIINRWLPVHQETST